MKSIGVTFEQVFTIEGKPHSVTLVAEYNDHARISEYFISAITETSFDLTNPSYGYLKYHSPRNTRLRSETSIVAEMFDVLLEYAKYIESIQDEIILTTRSIKAKIDYTTCYTWVKNAEFFSAGNIESKQSGQVLSWYEHNVFKQGEIEIEAFRKPDGQLRFRADENQLYDFDKLRKLYESDSFQNSKFAFFLYNECRRLLGMPVNGSIQRMSGFMPSDVQE